jgi:hypothetical protein
MTLAYNHSEEKELSLGGPGAEEDQAQDASRAEALSEESKTRPASQRRPHGKRSHTNKG